MSAVSPWLTAGPAPSFSGAGSSSASPWVSGGSSPGGKASTGNTSSLLPWLSSGQSSPTQQGSYSAVLAGGKNTSNQNPSPLSGTSTVTHDPSTGSVNPSATPEGLTNRLNVPVTNQQAPIINTPLGPAFGPVSAPVIGTQSLSNPLPQASGGLSQDEILAIAKAANAFANAAIAAGTVQEGQDLVGTPIRNASGAITGYTYRGA
jgi:hypothetical protein